MSIKCRTPRSADPTSQMIALKCTFYFQIWDIIICLLNDSNVMYFANLFLTDLLKMMQTIKTMRKQSINYLTALIYRGKALRVTRTKTKLVYILTFTLVRAFHTVTLFLAHRWSTALGAGCLLTVSVCCMKHYKCLRYSLSQCYIQRSSSATEYTCMQLSS